MRTRRAGFAVSATALALLAIPASAGEIIPLGDGSATNNADLLGSPAIDCANCAATPPYEWGNQPFELDWSLGLRGGIKDDGTGGSPSYELIALPSVTKIVAMTPLSRTPIAIWRLSLAGTTTAPAKKAMSSDAKSSPCVARFFNRFGSSHTIFIDLLYHEKSWRPPISIPTTRCTAL